MLILRLALTAALSATAAAAAAQPRYSIESLGEGRVMALNDSGWVTGSEGDRQVRPFVQVGGNRQYIEGPGVWAGRGQAIDAEGRVVGMAWDTVGGSSAFSWRDGRLRRLPLPAGASGSTAQDINRRGDVVGMGVIGGRSVALVWSGDSVRLLPASTTVGDAGAMALNDVGWVVGFVSAPQNRRRAALWRDGVLGELGTPSDAVAVAVDVNGRGQVVGWSQSPAGEMRAFLWENGRLTELAPGVYSEAIAIDDAGRVVGHADTGGEFPRPVLWEGDRMTLLEDLLPPGHGWTLTSVKAINTRGWMIGVGRRGGRMEAWVMKPLC